MTMTAASRSRAALAVVALCANLLASVACAQESPPVRTVYLIRHGAYLPDPRANPQAGPGLSSLGIAQARLIATRLRAMPVAFDSLTSSTMKRAQQTAAIVHEQIADVPASASELLSECTPPARIPLGSSQAAAPACKQRLDAAFAKFFTPASGADRHDVLVCHGNVIRYLTTKALGVDTQAWVGMTVAHTSVTIIQVLPGGVLQVAAVGDTGHVPPTLLSFGDDSDPHLVAPSAP